jgi:hypothetical protein
MAFIHQEILEHFKANSWETMQYKKNGVAVFTLWNNDVFVAEGTLLELSNKAKQNNV